MKRIFFYLFLVFLMPSCAEKSLEKKESIPLESVPNYFTEHFEPVSIIPIETSDSLLLSNIDRIIKVKEDFLLLSKQVSTVILIDGRSGKQKTQYGGIGTGPGESRKIIDIAYDEKNNRILIYNDYSKLLFFDIKGQFLSEVKINGLYENIVCQGDEVLFYQEGEGYSCLPYRIGRYSLENNGWTIQGTDTSIKFPIRSTGRQMVKSKNIWFNAPLDFNLYRLTEKGYENVYDLDISKSELTDNFIRLSSKNPMQFFMRTHEQKIVYSINSIRETNNYLFFRTNLMDFCFLNKKQNKVYTDKFLLWDFFTLSPTEYVSHDGDDNLLLFVLPAEKWVNGVNVIAPEWKDKIKDFNVKRDDNPILLFFKEKEIYSSES